MSNSTPAETTAAQLAETVADDGTRIRRAMFMAYSYRWLTSRDIPFEDGRRRRDAHAETYRRHIENRIRAGNTPQP